MSPSAGSGLFEAPGHGWANGLRMATDSASVTWLSVAELGTEPELPDQSPTDTQAPKPPSEKDGIGQEE